MTGLREHLTLPLYRGGHFLTPESVDMYTDLAEVHTDDHRPGWWSEILRHDHPEARP